MVSTKSHITSRAITINLSYGAIDVNQWVVKVIAIAHFLKHMYNYIFASTSI
jgi:hypothetical protein